MVVWNYPIPGLVRKEKTTSSLLGGVTPVARRGGTVVSRRDAHVAVVASRQSRRGVVAHRAVIRRSHTEDVRRTDQCESNKVSVQPVHD
jgi:hypothetical protein